MNQTRLYVALPRQAAQHAAQLLEASFEEDGFPVAAFETDEKRDLWSVSLYAPEDIVEEVETRMAAALADAGICDAVRREALTETDWVSKTLRELTPVRSGRFVVHGSHDRAVPRPHERAILIDAGLAFGTGHHGTTAGCLDMLGMALKNRRIANALDLGTGSGVLAIAIAKSAPVPVLASDIDPVATATARANGRLNGVAAHIACITAAGFGHRGFAEAGPFDLVVANILAGPLQAMARDLARHVAPGGTVVLSGLLPHQKARIVAAYRLQGLAFERAHHRDGWLTLVLRRGGLRSGSRRAGRPGHNAIL